MQNRISTISQLFDDFKMCYWQETDYNISFFSTDVHMIMLGNIQNMINVCVALKSDDPILVHNSNNSSIHKQK